MKNQTHSDQVKMMQLEDFVAESISQVIRGVEIAQNETKDTGALIHPVGTYVFKDNRNEQIDRRYYPTEQLIEFDVAVTATSGGKAKGGIGVFIGEVGLGVQTQADIIDSIVSRIKFSIPIYLPQQYDEDLENTPKSPARTKNPLSDVKGL